MDMNELIQCPFEDNHKVSRRRFQHHITNCVKTYKGRKMPCPYNAVEYFYPEEFEEHFKECRSAGNAIAQLYSMNPERDAEARRRMVPAPFHHDDLPEPTEAWGLD